MKFYRFRQYWIFSNFGSYSPVERDLLEKESAIARILKQNPWLPPVPAAKPLVSDFLTIQQRTDVREPEYGALGMKLDQIRQRLDRLATKKPIMTNHQPDALVGEIRQHLEERRRARAQPDQASRGVVIHYPADARNHKAANFHHLLGTGQRVLWTLDVEHCLSIGDPVGNKHSVVAVGKDVLGAGTAQLKLDPRTDSYLAMKDCEASAKDYTDRAARAANPSDQKTLLENAQHRQGLADDYRKALNGWRPPAKMERVVVLDFDSGHYAPRKAWKESTQAWNQAGYQVEWSTTSKFV